MALMTVPVPEDVGALFLGPSFLTADPMVPLLDQDEEEALSLSSALEESSTASPSPTLSSSLSLSPYQTLCPSPLSSSFSPPASPLSSPSSFLEPKVGADALSFPWLGAAELLHAHVGADVSRDDPFSGMDWMAEKIDLSDFDLDSLMGSSDEPPSSPEDLIATLDSQMDLDVHNFDSPIVSPLDALALPLPLPDLVPLPLEPPPVTLTVSPNEEEEQQATLMVKTEPLSPPPFSHLELGSEVDVLEVEKNAPTLNANVMPFPTGDLPTTTTTTTTSFLVSLTTAGPYVVLLTAKAEPFQESPNDQTSAAQEAFPPDEASPVTSDCDSDSGIESASSSPPRISSPSPSSPSSAGSSRTKPYSRPEAASTDRKSAGGAPPRVVEKKLKKMEQNKTAATRYRQKKRVEQEVLSGECDELETKNHALAEKVDALSREIKYLKDLMEEVRNAKNRRSKTVSA
ncbi:cyclic AMP-dependent transcription factor ATF-4 [Gadus chalcogrammus]|uniref:cyclic AMP-dependent transcription factor ATF-4 n=1 Tax=Gadus chalcogrammus TaxID=1042646 RepID=UPI0024C38025|nr:cyclic AMP-dependent transcription factor ATF-4 [Gadus chalcogrammus]